MLRELLLGLGAPAGSDDWERVIALADELLVAPRLWHTAARRRSEVSPAVREAMLARHLLNTARNLRFRRALDEIVAGLDRAGVETLLFKGGLWLAEGENRPAGGRVMTDLDLAVAPNEWERARAVLVEHGYGPVGGRLFAHPHELPFDRDGAPGPIELHAELGSAPLARVLPAAEAWAASRKLTLPSGAHARGLTPTHQALHAILHTAVQDLNDAVGGLPLRQLLVLAELERAHGTAIDWGEIRWRLAAAGLERVLHRHLWLAHRFAGLSLPAGVPVQLGLRLHEWRVLAGFALGWPPEVQRNLRYAFGREYLDSLYGHGDRPLRLLAARSRHALRLAGRGTLDELLVRRG